MCYETQELFFDPVLVIDGHTGVIDRGHPQWDEEMWNDKPGLLVELLCVKAHIKDLVDSGRIPGKLAEGWKEKETKSKEKKIKRNSIAYSDVNEDAVLRVYILMLVACLDMGGDVLSDLYSFYSRLLNTVSSPDTNNEESLRNNIDHLVDLGCITWELAAVWKEKLMIESKEKEIKSNVIAKADSSDNEANAKAREGAVDPPLVIDQGDTKDLYFSHIRGQFCLDYELMPGLKIAPPSSLEGNDDQEQGNGDQESSDDESLPPLVDYTGSAVVGETNN